MKLVSRETCRAVSRRPEDEFPADVVVADRQLRHREALRYQRRRGDHFPPYVSGCRGNVVVGAAAAVAASSGTEPVRQSTTSTTGRRGTIAESALARYGD